MDLPTLYAIDFGTSNSLLAAANRARVFEPVPLDPAAPDPTILRSILCFPDAGGVHVGAEALAKFIEHDGEACLIRSIKRHLGSRSFRGTIVAGRMVTAEELVGARLEQLRGFHSVVEGLAREAWARESGQLGPDAARPGPATV